MLTFQVAGIDTEIARQVRATGCAVAYPHPTHREVARGSGPCRHCLNTFRIGEEERILFTHQPFSSPDTIPAPVPVFIHANDCPRYDAREFPAPLRVLPLVFDGIGAMGLPRRQLRVSDGDAESAIAELFADPDVWYVHVRHGEAGCFVARVDRND